MSAISTSGLIAIVTENLQELLGDISSFSIQKVKLLLSRLKVDEGNVYAQELYEDLGGIYTCIDSVSTEHKQLTVLKRKGLYLAPIPIAIGSRTENCRSRDLRFKETKCIEDTFQYIPIEEILARIILECQNCSISLNCHTYKSREGNITDYFDTDRYSRHSLFSKYPDALILHMYIDGFETTNPLGAKTGIHKMEGLYMVVRNLPAKFLSKESSIFLVAVWYAQGVKVKSNAYSMILAPIIESLNKLDTDLGVEVTVDGINVNVRASLALFSADNLGFHSLFGFLESFSARKFCRMCETTKEDSQVKYYESDFVMRTRESYDAAVAQIGQPNYKESETGIKNGCILNDLKSFHVMENYVLDAMHDILEGVAPVEIGAILDTLCDAGYFSLSEFNLLVRAFDFCPEDENSSPNTFATLSTLKMSASECWCLMRNLPCIVGHKVPRNNPHWRLFLLLLEIADIIFAPKVNPDLAGYLSHLISDHHQLFVELYPEKRLSPKHHFLIHYPFALVQCGPPCRYWCMRFESRHNFFKTVTRASNCFKNIPKSLAKRNQLMFANALLSHSVFSNRTIVGHVSEKEVLCVEPEDVRNFLCDAFHLCWSETVHLLKWVQVGHYKLLLRSIVVLDTHAGTPEFGHVEAIVCFGDNTVLLVKKLKVNHFDEHFHAYSAVYDKTSSISSTYVSDLKDHIPLHMHSVLYEGKLQTFVSPRYAIF